MRRGRLSRVADMIRIDSVATDLVSLMLNQFDEKKNKVSNFEQLAYMFSTEAIGTIVFDTRIGVLGKSNTADLKWLNLNRSRNFAGRQRIP